MSEDSKGTSGAPTEASGDGQEKASQTTTDSKSDVVAYETHKKLLAEKKALQAKFEAEMAEKQKLLEEKLTVEGKKDELIESYKKKLNEYEQKTKKVVGSFSERLLQSAISTEASKEGCLNVSDLLRLSDTTELVESMDEEFNFDAEKVKELVAKAKKERAYLFNKTAPQAKTGIPTTGVVSKGEEWTKLPLKEQAKLAFTMGKK